MGDQKIKAGSEYMNYLTMIINLLRQESWFIMLLRENCEKQ